MRAYTNVTADDWVLADPDPPLAGECLNCHRAVQECRHAPGCYVWVDVDGGATCTDEAVHLRVHVVAHPEPTPGCCCYPEPCAGHLVGWQARHPAPIACNEPSFHGNGV